MADMLKQQEKIMVMLLVAHVDKKIMLGMELQELLIKLQLQVVPYYHKQLHLVGMELVLKKQMSL